MLITLLNNYFDIINNVIIFVLYLITKIIIKMIIKESIIEKMKNDPVLKSDLVRVTGKSYPTICRWIGDNDEMLTLKSCVDLIKESYQITDEELFEAVPS